MFEETVVEAGMSRQHHHASQFYPSAAYSRNQTFNRRSRRAQSFHKTQFGDFLCDLCALLFKHLRTLQKRKPLVAQARSFGHETANAVSSLRSRPRVAARGWPKIVVEFDRSL